MMKKIVALILVVMLALGSVGASAYSTSDAYNEFYSDYPDFVDSILNENISKSLIMDFLEEMRDYLSQINKDTKITLQNFEENAITTVSRVSSMEKYIDLQNALIKLYPTASKNAIMNNKVDKEFEPLMNTIKKIIFDHKMLENDFSQNSGSSSNSGSSPSDDKSKTIKTINGINKTIVLGEDFSLPSTIECITYNGEKLSVPVTWLGTVSLGAKGTYSVKGVLSVPKEYSLDLYLSNTIEYTIHVVDEKDGSFIDVSSEHWAFPAIKYLSENFILNGYLDKTFRPDENITRAEFAKIIVSACSIYDDTADAQFSDVNNDDWYSSYVASAYKKGYINGFPDNTFRPDEKITRADICTIVYRCIKDKSISNNNTIKFSDDNDISEYAKEAVYALSQKKVVSGMGNGAFSPNSPATRAQTAKIVYQALFQN